MAKYRKALAAVVGVVLTGLVALYGNNAVVQLVVSVLVAAGVYQLPNAKK